MKKLMFVLVFLPFISLAQTVKLDSIVFINGTSLTGKVISVTIDNEKNPLNDILTIKTTETFTVKLIEIASIYTSTYPRWSYDIIKLHNEFIRKYNRTAGDELKAARSSFYASLMVQLISGVTTLALINKNGNSAEDIKSITIVPVIGSIISSLFIIGSFEHVGRAGEILNMPIKTKLKRVKIFNNWKFE